MIRTLKKHLPSRKGLLGINGRNLECIYPYNRRRFFPNVDDKLQCKSLLAAAGVPVPTTYYVVRGPAELKNWPESLREVNQFVIKPNRGFGGSGIMLVTREEGLYRASGHDLQEDDVTFHVIQICNGAFAIDNLADTAYFEQTVSNHPDLSYFLPEGIDGVADIRLIFEQGRPVMAMMRLPTRESEGKANLHQGGIGVGIDLKTGRSLNGCYRNNVIRKHPESGVPLAGREIPHFQEMLRLGAGICDIVELGYIGVDFVCDRDYGPQVLEVNARPGLNIQIANETGLRERLWWAGKS